MSPKDLTEKADVGISIITKMRKGEGSITADAWDKSCQALGCNIADILEIVPSNA